MATIQATPAAGEGATKGATASIDTADYLAVITLKPGTAPTAGIVAQLQLSTSIGLQPDLPALAGTTGAKLYGVTATHQAAITTDTPLAENTEYQFAANFGILG